MEIIELVARRQELLKELEGLVYGTVEIRQKGELNYLYVHFREKGIKQTRYVGVYSQELHNLVLANSARAKAIKKEIRQLEKKLKESGFIETDLSPAVQKNIDFAKRQLVDTIYKQAVLEGIATTYANTETIIEGGKVQNMTAEDVLKVLNLKHAWEFILNENVVQSFSNFAILCEINKLVLEGIYYNAGQVRSIPVSIGGTNWKPSLPIESDLKDHLSKILSQNITVIDKAIELLLFVMKKQIFIDGNKRTAVVFANHFLVQNAGGLIVIPDNQIEQYKNLLIAYYEGKDEKSIKTFLKKYAHQKL